MTMSGDEAERYLLSLELFGMRFGLERMRRLMTALDHPERAFDSIHVVGTNGKSSTTRMIAAILREHGLRTGAYLSPHLLSFGERIRIGDDDLTPAQFGAAVAQAKRAAEKVDRTAADDDHVTQFEALTAAAYFEMARQNVEVAVVEAGLGGRFDATNVIPSKVQVLTSVGLEHTRWLGPTIADIAGEKLDVVQPAATLVLGAGLDPDAVAIAEAVAARRDATIVRAGTDPGVTVGAPGAYQRRNFALARAGCSRSTASRSHLSTAPTIPTGSAQSPSPCPSSSVTTAGSSPSSRSSTTRTPPGCSLRSARRSTSSSSPTPATLARCPRGRCCRCCARCTDPPARSCPTRAGRCNARGSSPAAMAWSSPPAP
jgi:hypothetical protein